VFLKVYKKKVLTINENVYILKKKSMERYTIYEWITKALSLLIGRGG